MSEEYLADFDAHAVKRGLVLLKKLPAVVQEGALVRMRRIYRDVQALRPAAHAKACEENRDGQGMDHPQLTDFIGENVWPKLKEAMPDISEKKLDHHVLDYLFVWVGVALYDENEDYLKRGFVSLYQNEDEDEDEDEIDDDDDDGGIT